MTPPCFRNAIAEAMVWCIETAECADEIVQCLAESLSILEVRLKHIGIKHIVSLTRSCRKILTPLI